MATKARMHLEGPKQREIIAVIGLLDLYGPSFFPSSVSTVEDRYQWGKQRFEREVNHPQFRFFFAVHEFEAWLLSQPDVFPRDIKNNLPKSIVRPEQVDFEEPPAKLLDRIYRQQTSRNYKKTTYGKQLFARLDPAIAMTKCPYLKQMLDEMLALAKAVGL
jgi:hypothetical protein